MQHIRTALLQLAAADPTIRGTVLPLARQADKWEGLPKGWDASSRTKFWETLTGDNKHKVTKCIKEMSKPGKDIDDPGAFCASLADRVLGKEWRTKKAGGMPTEPEQKIIDWLGEMPLNKPQAASPISLSILRMSEADFRKVIEKMVRKDWVTTDIDRFGQLLVYKTRRTPPMGDLPSHCMRGDGRHAQMAASWTLAEGMEMFDQWYKSTGHWVYPTREKALKVWQTRGIENLPDYKRLKRAAQEQTPNMVDGAAARFKDQIEVTINEHNRMAFPAQVPPTLTLVHGNDFIRVVKADGGRTREAVAFIARTTGNVYLAATWDRPKPFVIANVLQTDSWRNMRLGFDQFNVPELLGQLKKVLLDKGLDETWDEIQKCRVPQKVNDAWMALSKKDRKKKAARLAELRARRGSYDQTRLAELRGRLAAYVQKSTTWDHYVFSKDYSKKDWGVQFESGHSLMVADKQEGEAVARKMLAEKMRLHKQLRREILKIAPLAEGRDGKSSTFYEASGKFSASSYAKVWSVFTVPDSTDPKDPYSRQQVNAIVKLLESKGFKSNSRAYD